MATNTNKQQQTQPQAGPIAQQLTKIRPTGHQAPSDGQQPSARKSQKRASKWTGFSDKTLWDWLQLLLLPLILTGFGYWFNTAQQNQTSLQVSERQHQTDIQLAIDQQRDATLKACIDDMKDLLLNKGLKTSKSGDEVRVVARAEVLSASRQLDGERKAILVKFLYAAELIVNTGNDVIIDLSNADLMYAHLRGADLSNAALSRANLFGADLSRANLSGASLSGADLSSDDLSGANLKGADLSHARLNNTNLSGANLSGANLRYARVTNEQLAHAQSLQDATIPDGSKHP